MKLLSEIYSTRSKNARDRSPQVNRSPHFNFQKQHRLQQDVNTYHIRISTSFHSSCVASTDSHNTACHSDCQSTATIKAFNSNFLFSCEEQQPGTSRHMIFNLQLQLHNRRKHNISGLSSHFEAIPSVLQYQQIDTLQPFSPSELQPAPSPVPSSTHHEQSRPPS